MRFGLTLCSISTSNDAVFFCARPHATCLSDRFPSMKRGENVDGRCKMKLPSMNNRDFVDGTAQA